MDKFAIKPDDLKLFNNLKKTTTTIESIYKKMYELEINNKSEDDSYFELINLLKSLVETENDLYKQINLDYNKAISILKYITNNKVSRDFITDFDSITSLDFNNRVYRRILATLMIYITSNKQFIKDYLDDDYLNFIKQNSKKEPYKLAVETSYLDTILRNFLCKDLLTGLLTFLQDNIDISNEYDRSKEKQLYLDCRDDLIRTKYFISFINKDVESDMISNNFVISEKICLDSKDKSDKHKIDPTLYNIVRTSTGISVSNKQLYDILEINNFHYYDSELATSVILKQCLMRSAFLLLNEDVLSKINYKYHYYIESNNYLSKHPNNSISEDIVSKGFKAINKDKSRLCFNQFFK